MKKVIAILAIAGFVACNNADNKAAGADSAKATMDTAAKKMDSAKATMDTAAKKMDSASKKMDKK